MSSVTVSSRIYVKSAFAAAALAFLVAVPLRAQKADSSDTTQLAGLTLPEAPSALASSSTSVSTASASPDSSFAQTSTGNPHVTGPIAPLYTKYIPAGETAQPITAHDKVIIGFKDAVSPENILGIVLSAGYEHVVNGSPNYGRNSTAFGKRVGASALRGTTEGLFTDTVFAPLFHEDPRYYVRGHGHSFVNRTFYAITRPIITRTDSGNTSVNGALITGYAAASALTYAYYPAINRNAKDTASTFGGALGGAALGFFVSEFESDALQAFHLKKK